MKINEIFEKNEQNLEDLSFFSENEIIKTLEKECSDIIKIYKGTKKLIFRGEKKEILFFKKKYPQKRIPRDTNSYIHRLINFILTKKGFKANRSNSVFTTSQKEIAISYGKPYVFFPKNGYSYTWSSDIFDLYFDMSKFIKNINKKDNNIYGFNGFFYKIKPNKKEKDVLDKIHDYLKNNNITLDKFDNLKHFFIFFNQKYSFLDSLQKKYFSYIIVDNFVSINEKDREFDEIFNEISDKFKNNDLNNAILSGNEILFTDDYFYMLNFNDVVFGINKYKELNNFLASLLGKDKLVIE